MTPAPARALPVRLGAWLLGALVVAVAVGAGPSEVVRVRVPSDQLVKFLPADAELRVLTRAEFELLVRSARAGAQRGGGQPPVRLIRAHHAARWDAGALLGHTELLVENPGDAPSGFPLAPWTPAIRIPGREESDLRAGADGRLLVWLADRGRKTVAFDWELRSVSGTEGRFFTLGLPRAEVSHLSLELPRGFEPDGPEGVRRDPSEGLGAATRTWQFEGLGGLSPLRIRSIQAPNALAPSPTLWVGGPTRVVVGEARADWTADWTIDPGAGGRRQFSVLLDPGLELVDVAGPDVVAFQAEPAGPATRLALRIAQDLDRPSKVTIKAQAVVPVTGAWPIPAARLPDASWTGGKTIVLLPPSRVLHDCREHAGRRIAPRAGDLAGLPTGGLGLVFESSAAESVAELTFGSGRPRVTAVVRGTLRFDEEGARAEAEVKYQVQRGTLFEVALRVPPGWQPIECREGSDETALRWRADPPEGGGSLLTYRLDAPIEAGGTLALRVAAILEESGTRETFALPRLAPVEAQVIDELWSAVPSGECQLRPVEARGLAWVAPTADPPGALAWRWLHPEGAARVARFVPAAVPSARCSTRATIASGRLTLDYLLEVAAAENLVRTLPIAFRDPVGGEVEWRLEVGRERLPARSRPRPPDTSPGTVAWDLELPHAKAGRFRIQGHWEGPWNGRAGIPLPMVLPPFRTRGVASVFVEPTTRTVVDAVGLHWLDRGPSPTAAGVDAGQPAEPRGSLRRAYAFAYGPHPGRLDVRTEILQPCPPQGVIQEATLTTLAAPRVSLLNRLTVRVAPAGARSLTVTLPRSAALERATLDRRPIVATVRDRSLVFELPEASRSRPLCVLALDYLIPQASGVRGDRLPTDRPVFSLPCLAFCWDLASPSPWVRTDLGADLWVTEPASGAPRARSALEAARESWTRRDTARRARSWTTAFREIEERVALPPGHETTLAQWLSRWDAGIRPVLVDRLGLALAGWEPRSPITFRSGAGETLRQLGLSVIPINEGYLITSQQEGLERHLRNPPEGERDTWHRAFREALVWGGDPTDRFQTVARWSGELAGNPPTEGPAPGPLGSRLTRGWSHAWFVAPDWPSRGAAVRLRNLQVVVRGGEIAGVVIFVLGLLVRRAAASVRLAGLATALAAGAAGWAWGDYPVAALSVGVLAGGLLVASAWLGGALRNLATRRSRRDEGSTRSYRPIAAGGLAVAIAGLCLGSLPSRTLHAIGVAVGSPIPAFFPYDDPLAPPGPEDRVVLRLRDHDRLRAWADRQKIRAAGRLLATWAEHHVERVGRSLAARVETRLALWSDSEEAADWSVPIGLGRDLGATLDGADVPVAIRPGGKLAVVNVRGKGRHELAFRRVVPLDRQGAADRLSLPVTPHAFARCTVAVAPGDPPIEVPTALGRVQAADGQVEAALGPAEQLRVDWIRDKRPEADPAGREVEALLLWDSEPAGDRVRARFTVRGPRPTASIRLGLEPGLSVRSHTIPGLIDATWAGSPEHPEWVARIEPPLPEGTWFLIDFWRSRSAGGPAPGATTRRQLPRIEAHGVERFSGLVGFRRPGDWTGRLAAAPGTSPVSDEAFVNAWGTLPEEPLTLAGVSRFVGPPAVMVEAGRAPLRRTVRTALELETDAGRLHVALRSVLTTQSGRSYEAQALVPPDLVVTRVEGRGLTSWSRPAPDRIACRFDGAELPRREVSVQGWLPIAVDPLTVGPVVRGVRIPWPQWQDAEMEPGTLAVRSSVPFLLDPAPDQALPLPAATASFHAQYKVNHPNELGRIVWSDDPRVKVVVQSHLTLFRDAVEWVARVRYQVAAGAIDRLYFQLPTAWAESAWIEEGGRGARLDSQARGEVTLWTIQADRSIWGTEELVIRSQRPFRHPGALSFPDLVPLGRGTAETVLGISNASGVALGFDRSDGLQPISPTPFDPEPANLVFGPVPTQSAYQVGAGKWSLRLRAGSGDTFDQAGEPIPHAHLADHKVVLARDGSVRGASTFWLDPGRAPFLTVRLPDDAVVIWASSDEKPTRPLRSEPTRWSIPLGNGLTRRVRLIWERTVPLATTRRDRPIDVPRLDQDKVPGLIELRLPDGATARPRGAGVEAVTPAGLQVERLEALREEIGGFLVRPDHGAGDDRPELEPALIRFELTSRAIERSAAVGGAPAGVLDRFRAVRTSLEEALAGSGLEAVGRSAHAQVEGDPRGGAPAPWAGWPIDEPVRLRLIGHPSAYRGTLTRSGPAPLTVTFGPPPASDGGRATYGVLGLALFAVPALSVLFGLGGRLLPVSVACLGAGVVTVAGAAGVDPLVWLMSVPALLLGLFRRP